MATTICVVTMNIPLPWSTHFLTFEIFSWDTPEILIIIHCINVCLILVTFTIIISMELEVSASHTSNNILI